MTTKVHCPDCHRQIPAKDININRVLAKCTDCDTVFDFSQKLKVRQIPTRPIETLPKGLDMIQTVSDLLIVISWRKTRPAGAFTFFTIFWMAVLTPFILIVISQNNVGMLLGISLHLLIGIAMAIYTIALYINTTVVKVNSFGVEVKNGPIPIPFMPNKKLHPNDIKQLYVEEYVASRTNNRPNIAYAVRAILHSGSTSPRLIKGLTKSEQALFLEQQIEEFLNIEDQIV